MIKAVIFDCFGVLTTDGWQRFLDTYLTDTELRTKAHDLIHSVDKGTLSHDDFLTQASALAEVEPQELVRMMDADLLRNDSLFDYIQTIKSRYKIGVLSNIARAGLFYEYFSSKDRSLFDEITLSSEVGLAKPDPVIFRYTSKKLGVKMNECIFVDDREKYCEAANEVGMQAILYQDFPQMKKDLEKILATSANN
jgi:epoxide hydrolase-like predicted phosphatase